jgi:hypothetical protein
MAFTVLEHAMYRFGGLTVEQLVPAVTIGYKVFIIGWFNMRGLEVDTVQAPNEHVVIYCHDTCEILRSVFLYLVKMASLIPGPSVYS